jgi:hypothetical protein
MAPNPGGQPPVPPDRRVRGPQICSDNCGMNTSLLLLPGIEHRPSLYLPGYIYVCAERESWGLYKHMKGVVMAN